MGAGSWGTAVSWMLGSAGKDIMLWARERDIADAINEEHRNPVYLTEVDLPVRVVATDDHERAVHGAELVVMVTPTIGIRETATRIQPYVSQTTPVVSLAKGLEKDTLMRMTEVLDDVLGNRSRLAALSGPNHAEEVSKGVPSATVVASYEEDTGRFVRSAFFSPMFRAYTNPDVVGVELGGATKNVIALAAGATDGLGFGDNTKAALLTRGLAEMSRLGVAMGAHPITFMGLAGMGDLIATAMSRHSRNRLLGEMIALGKTVEDFYNETHMVAEGATAALTIDELGRRHGVDMPITHVVRGVLYEGASIADALGYLLGREATDELHSMGLIGDEEE
jgi:glycerol-3-phosphate dehydrogenase (NAD(P)+)